MFDSIALLLIIHSTMTGERGILLILMIIMGNRNITGGEDGGYPPRGGDEVKFFPMVEGEYPGPIP